MTPLNSENLDLKYENGVAFMTVSGQVTDEELQEGVTWFSAVGVEHDLERMCVDMSKSDFEDLSAVNKGFRDVGYVLRRAPSVDKCAVLSDSAFVRSSAKIEGAVIPGMQIKSYRLNETASALTWLGADEAAIKTAVEDADAKAANKPDSKSEPIQAATAPTADTPATPDVVVESDNPWDNLKMKNVDY